MPAPGARGAGDSGGRGVPLASGRARPHGRLCGRRDDRDDLDELDRPGRPDRGRVRERGRLAARRRRVRRLGGGLSRAARRLRRLGAGGLDCRQPPQVALDTDGLLGLLDAASRGPARRFQPGARVPACERGRREPVGVQPGARTPVPGAEALGRAPLLRARGAAAADPRGDRAGGAVRRVGARRAGVGGDRAATVLTRVLPPGRDRRGERGAARARQRDRRDLHLAHEAERALHASAGRRQRAHDRGRRAACVGRAPAEAG